MSSPTTQGASDVHARSSSFAYDRGRITALGGGSLTIKRASGQSVTFSYDASTVVREKGQSESVSDLAVGEGAMFVSQSGALKLVRSIAPPRLVSPPAGQLAPAAA